MRKENHLPHRSLQTRTNKKKVLFAHHYYCGELLGPRAVSFALKSEGKNVRNNERACYTNGEAASYMYMYEYH